MDNLPNKIVVANLNNDEATENTIPLMDLVTDTIAELIVSVADMTNHIIEQQQALDEYSSVASSFISRNFSTPSTDSWVMDTGIGDMILQSVRDGITKEVPASITQALSEFYLGDEFREAMGMTDEQREKKETIDKENNENTKTLVEATKEGNETARATRKAQEDQGITLETILQLSQGDIEDRRAQYDERQKEKEAEAYAKAAVEDKYGPDVTKAELKGTTFSDALNLPDDHPVKKMYMEAIGEKQERDAAEELASKNRETASTAGDLIGQLGGGKGVLGDVGGLLKGGKLPFGLDKVLGGLGGAEMGGGIATALGGTGALGALATAAPYLAAGVAAVGMINSGIESVAKTDREATSAGQTLGASVQSTTESKIAGFLDPTLSGKDAEAIYSNAFKAGLKGETQAEAVAFQKEMLKEYGISANESFKTFNEKVLSGAVSSEQLKESMDKLSEAAKEGAVNLSKAAEVAEAYGKTLDNLFMLTEAQKEKLQTEIGAAAAASGVSADVLKLGAGSSLVTGIVQSMSYQGIDPTFSSIWSEVESQMQIGSAVDSLESYMAQNPKLAIPDAVREWVSGLDPVSFGQYASQARGLGFNSAEEMFQNFIAGRRSEGEVPSGGAPSPTTSKPTTEDDDEGHVNVHGVWVPKSVMPAESGVTSKPTTEDDDEDYIVVRGVRMPRSAMPDGSGATSKADTKPAKVAQQAKASAPQSATNVNVSVTIDSKEVRSALKSYSVDEGDESLPDRGIFG